MKTLSFKTCEKLKEVLGVQDFQPEQYWLHNEDGEIEHFTAHKDVIDEFYSNNEILCPAYTVQDILSRPFLEALGKKLGWKKYFDTDLCVNCQTLQYGYSKKIERCYDCITQDFEEHGVKLLKEYWESQEKLEEVLLELIEKK